MAADLSPPVVIRSHGGRPRSPVPVAAYVGLASLGALTALLGSVVHLARTPALGVLVPYGVLLAVALVVACDVTVAAGLHGRRPGPAGALLSVAAGRGLALGLLLLPTGAGDVVLTGLPASTAWILLAVLVPAFAAPMATALAVSRQRSAAPGPGARR